MAFIGSVGTGAPFATSSALTYESALSQLIEKGWTVASEGASGAQLKKAKTMRSADKWCIGLGVPLLLVGAGLLLIIIGLLDYAFFTKDQLYFLRRETPAMPPEDKTGSVSLGRIALLLAIIGAVIAGAMVIVGRG